MSIIGEPAVRWKLLIPVVGSTKAGSAVVWKFAQPLPPGVVVGPREKVIAQFTALFEDAPSIGSWTMLELRVRSASPMEMSLPLPQLVTLRALRFPGLAARCCPCC